MDNINKKGISDFVTQHLNKANREVATEPWNSFGRIDFQGYGPCMSTGLYARIDSNSPADTVYKLLHDHWKMPEPKLIFSVTGGAKDYQPSEQAKLKYFLRRGLVEAAVSTETGTGQHACLSHFGLNLKNIGELVAMNHSADQSFAFMRVSDIDNVGAWIITGGTAAGVMKLVGEAVNDYMTVHEASNEEQCVALGIAPWGCVAHRDELQSKSKHGSIKGEWDARYVNESKSKKDTLLDSNHTHFLLVDDGTEGTYGAEIDFRSRLEAHISKMDVGHKVHAVLIVVEGGVGTIKTVIALAEKGTPVVIIKGSGRAADVMARVFESDKEDNEALKQEIGKKFPEMSTKEEINKLLKSRKDLKKFISVLDLESGSEQDIETAILRAIVNVESDKTDDNSVSFKSKLLLAIRLKMYDVARQSILATPPKEKNVLLEVMSEALIWDRADFVEHFINCDVDLKKFLTQDTLTELYDKCLKKDQHGEAQILNHIKNAVSQPQEQTLKAINKVIIRLLQDQSFQFYKANDKGGTSGSNDNEKRTQDITNVSEHPLLHLFIFSVLFNRRKLSQVFLKHVSSPISTALLGCAILRAMARKAETAIDTKSNHLHLEHSQVLFDFAVQVLNECNHNSKAYSHMLLATKCDDLCSLTILEFVEAQELMGFAEQSACQTKLTDMWQGTLKRTHWPRILITTLIPLCLVTMKFKPYYYSRSRQGALWSNNKIDDDKNQPLSITPKSAKNHRQSSSKYLMQQFDAGMKDVIHCGRRPKCIDIVKAPIQFYSAPVSKFTSSVLSYLALLGLFSYVLLTDLKPHVLSREEIVVLVWFSTMILEDFRQFLQNPRGTMRSEKGGFQIALALKYKGKAWWTNVWKRFDLAIYISLIISFIMRMTLSESEFIHARAVYSITLVLSFMHLLQFFRASKEIGPKVIMIKRMLRDLFSFLLIVLIFILSFGIAYHINMFPDSPPDWEIFGTVLFYPYYQIYGEIFLDDLKDGGGEDSDCTHNETIWLSDITKRCPKKSPVVEVLLSAYLILTNVLLLNLLIAMFSHTFAKVQEKSTEVWHFHRISLVHEYFDSPALPPPLNVIVYLYRIVQWIRGLKAKAWAEDWGMPREEVMHKVEVLQRIAVDKILALEKKTSKDTDTRPKKDGDVKGVTSQSSEA